jgi:hypothetical protein
VTPGPAAIAAGARRDPPSARRPTPSVTPARVRVARVSPIFDPVTTGRRGPRGLPIGPSGAVGGGGAAVEWAYA